MLFIVLLKFVVLLFIALPGFLAHVIHSIAKVCCTCYSKYYQGFLHMLLGCTICFISLALMFCMMTLFAILVDLYLLEYVVILRLLDCISHIYIYILVFWTVLYYIWAA